MRNLVTVEDLGGYRPRKGVILITEMRLSTSFNDGTVYQDLGGAQEAINGVGATDIGVSAWHVLSVGIPNIFREPAHLNIVSHVERGAQSPRLLLKERSPFD